MNSIFDLQDEYGPARVLHVGEPRIGLRGILVVDNVARGPAIGGLRMAPDVSLEECARLARAMTFKNAAADLAHGGGKSVLFGDPRMAQPEKERLIRAFACALRNVHEYIVGPDMGTDEMCMGWAFDEIGRACGLPRALGGIPLDELGATGWGMLHATEAAAATADLEIPGARLAVQGFGAVGIHAARFLVEKGAILVAASDSRGSVSHPSGLSVPDLMALKHAGKSVAESSNGQVGEREAIIDVECDIWIPAARPDVITEDNVDRLRTRLVIQGANIPVTRGAEETLHARGVVNVPDFIANAGGVICAAMEYHGSSERAAFEAIAEKVRRNTEEVLARAARDSLTPREAAEQMAGERVRDAMALRRWNVF